MDVFDDFETYEAEAINNDDDDDDDGSNYDQMDEFEEVDSIDENDGFADMMSKILNQKVDNRLPILAKRKTSQMKGVEEFHKKKEENKVLRVERKRKRESFLKLPDHTTFNFERNLRKIATRGVVALFNAISEAKKTTQSEIPELLEHTKHKGKAKLDLKAVRKNSLDVASSTTTNKPKRVRSDITKEKPISTTAEGNESTKKWSIFKGPKFEKRMSIKNWDENDDGDD